jgi:hypothetical protein
MWIAIPVALYIVSFGCLCAGIYTVVQAIRLRRAYERLGAVMMELALMSFINQHIPFWIPWSKVTGLSFHIGVEQEEEEEARN